MDPDEIAQQLTRLLTFGDEKQKAEAQRVLGLLDQQAKLEATQYAGNRTEFGAPTPTGTIFESLARLGTKVKAVAQGLNDTYEATYPDGTLPESDILGTLGSAARATRDFLSPGSAGQSLLDSAGVVPQVQPGPTPTGAIDQELGLPAAPVVDPNALAAQQQQAQLQALLQQQAAQQQANELAAAQALQAQFGQVQGIQANQIGSIVANDELQRLQELIGLQQVPQVNGNVLTNAAAFADSPQISTSPTSVTGLLPVQQSIGQVTQPSLQAAAQTNINQRQRVGQVETGFIEQNAREQERALELARQQYITTVANKVFQRRR